MSELPPGPEPVAVTTPFESPSEYAAAWDTLLPLAVTDILSQLAREPVWE